MMKNTKKYFNKLIKRIAVKDDKALEELYGIYGKLIYATALTISKSSVAADEIVDDILVKIWNYAGKLPKINNPGSYLYVLTANCARDRIKSEKQFVALFDLKEDEIQADIQPDDDFYAKISILNDMEQEIMIFKFVHDLTFERISKEMKKPLSTITSTYYRALEKLKK